MSNVYQPKRKELAKVEVVASEVYDKNRSQLKLIGSVQRDYTNFMTTQRNKKIGICTYIDDTSSLTKKTKHAIVRFFSDKRNQRKGVVYLVVPKEVTTISTSKNKQNKEIKKQRG